MYNILMLTTGGTIMSVGTEEGYAPTSPDFLLKEMGEVSKDYNVVTKEILRLDSSNIQPEEWKIIAREVYAAGTNYDGIVIVHGTDTMSYTASMLSFMLRNLPIPVVITGSQVPVGQPFSDAISNLVAAFAMAASGTPGVFVAFDRKIILGSRAVKVRTTGFNAFESINAPYAAVIDATGLSVNNDVIVAPEGSYMLEDNYCSNVFLLKITPGSDPAIIEKLMEMGYKGIVIEAFGIGGIQFMRRDFISILEKAREKGVAVVVCSQCLYERSDFSIYQVGQKVLQTGAIQAFDMTSEAAVTKLMWALGQTDDLHKIRVMFETNYAGEISF